MTSSEIRLSVVEQLVLDLLLESSYVGKYSWRQSLVIEAFRPWFSPSRTRTALKRLEREGLVLKLKKSPLIYAVNHELAATTLSSPQATVAGDVFRLVAVMHSTGDLYTERSTIDTLPHGKEDIAAALDTLIAELLLIQSGSRYYLYFADGEHEVKLAKAIDDLGAFLQDDAWLADLIFGARDLPGPKTRSRPSGLAERLAAVS